MFPMQERQLSFSSLFKKPVHNAIRHFFLFIEKMRIISKIWVKQDEVGI